MNDISFVLLTKLRFYTSALSAQKRALLSQDNPLVFPSTMAAPRSGVGTTNDNPQRKRDGDLCFACGLPSSRTYTVPLDNLKDEDGDEHQLLAGSPESRCSASGSSSNSHLRDDAQIIDFNPFPQKSSSYTRSSPMKLA